MKHLVIAAGGTGGHMFPAEALAREMLARGWRVTLSTDARGAAYAGGFPEAVTRDVVRAASFARGGVLAKAIAPLRIMAGVIAALARMRKDRPDAVIGFGGYPAFPAMSAAWALGIPRMLHEQNGVLGRVNRLFARRVDLVACGVWPTDLPPGAIGRDIGNPLRPAILAAAGRAYDPNGPILVMGGSQGASILSQVVPGALARLTPEQRAGLRLVHQAREADRVGVEAAYGALGIDAEVRPFFDDIAERLGAARLVIARAGASSVAEIAAIGRPALLVPLAIATHDHQTANARPLADAGGAWLVPEAEFTKPRLADLLAQHLADPARARAMAEAAHAQGRPGATRALADALEALPPA